MNDVKERVMKIDQFEKIATHAHQLMADQDFDSIAVAAIDFKSNQYLAFEFQNGIRHLEPFLFFDLASLTKALTNSAVRLKYPDFFDHNLDLLLNHKAGLPLGGRLSKKGWKEFIQQYDIKESETLYSDYSSLRTMLELEKKSGKSLKELCSFYFDEELVYWNELPEYALTPKSGMREKKDIHKEVHDDNCFVINQFVSHAGLFATIDGLAKSLLNLNQQTSMIQQLQQKFKSFDHANRFIFGFDHPQDLENTLAGKGCSTNTFGHLGFTGTSFWIDSDKSVGHIILTNATQNYWYSRAGLTKIRKELGTELWHLLYCQEK